MSDVKTEFSTAEETLLLQPEEKHELDEDGEPEEKPSARKRGPRDQMPSIEMRNTHVLHQLRLNLMKIKSEARMQVEERRAGLKELEVKLRIDLLLSEIAQLQQNV